MNILITGGTGFIGKALCKRLLELNHSLIVLTRNSKKANRILGSQVKTINSLGEIENTAMINAVINLAGEPIADKKWTRERKRLIESSRIDLTNELVAFMRSLDTPPEVLISGSAIGYYGEGGEEILTEHTEPHDEFSHRLCASWEMQALRAKADNIRVAIIRTGLVIGKGGGFLKKMLPSYRLGLGAQLGGGQQWMSWIHLDDYLNIILFILNNEKQSGIYNATAPNPVPNKLFSNMLAAVLKRPRFLVIPQKMLEFMFGEMSHLLTTSQRVIPSKLQKEGFEFKYPALRPALESICN